jgi:hydroxymethylpyrimidine pyrophosphatase-like HAD family hydrolase
MANFFGMVNSWMIVEGGAALFNPTTREVKMNPAITPDMEKFFKWVANKKVPAILARHRYLQRYLGYMVCQSLEKKAGSSVELEPAINDIIQRQWRRHGWSLYKWIKRRRLKVERYFNRAINIIPAGVSKGTAVKFLMGIEGWDPSWCIAVGDSESDFPLFRSVGRIGCPSNATPGCIKFVREHRGKVSIHPYTRGVLDVIDWWLGNESMG